MRPLRARVAFLGLLALSVWPAAARAQGDETSAADRSAARELGIAGVRLAEKGQCKEAIEKLERAEKLYHAPTTLERLAECQIHDGRVVEGTENLQRVVREQLPPNPPKAFVAAKARAQAALKKALPRIAKLHIEVAAPEGAEVKVTIDDEPVPSAFLGTDRPTDPGAHTIEASAPRMLSAQARVTLKEGDSQSVSLKLEPDPNASAEVAHTTPTRSPHDGARTPEQAPVASGGGGSPTLAYVALGIGAAGVAVGSVAGVLALSKKNDVDKQCPDKASCPESARADLDAAKTMGLVSTIGFIAGGVGLAGGVVLLLTSGGSSQSATIQTGSVRAEPVLGAGYVGLRGSF